tara:strand:- start:21061 stop:21846 length:786 start_codon:yes stop_codon:yes gene_type:complete
MSLPIADKRLGQHFLRDAKIIETITSDHEDGDHAILEIGPGPAILTPHLAARGRPFAVIEMDRRFEELLLPITPNVHIGDALKVDLDSFIAEKFPDSEVMLVSNLPYNVSVPLLTKFIATPAITRMTLMFQKEVADKVFSEARNGLGSLMALTCAYFEVKPLCKVPPGAFAPPPKVDSAVISLKRRANPLIPFDQMKHYETFLRLFFSQKRKQLGSVLKTRYSSEQIESSLEKIGHNRTIRAEALTLDDVIKLYSYLESAK